MFENPRAVMPFMASFIFNSLSKVDKTHKLSFYTLVTLEQRELVKTIMVSKEKHAHLVKTLMNKKNKVTKSVFEEMLKQEFNPQILDGFSPVFVEKTMDKIYMNAARHEDDEIGLYYDPSENSLYYVSPVYDPVREWVKEHYEDSFRVTQTREQYFAQVEEERRKEAEAAAQAEIEAERLLYEQLPLRAPTQLLKCVVSEKEMCAMLRIAKTDSKGTENLLPFLKGCVAAVRKARTLWIVQGSQDCEAAILRIASDTAVVDVQLVQMEKASGSLKKRQCIEGLPLRYLVSSLLEDQDIDPPIVAFDYRACSVRTSNDFIDPTEVTSFVLI